METTVSNSTHVELVREFLPCLHYFNPFLPPINYKAFGNVTCLVDLITAVHSCVCAVRAKIRHHESVMLGKVLDEREPCRRRSIHVIAT